jgi:glutathione synthase/RimK-type ligase-like ATP-grasp enzyme
VRILLVYTDSPHYQGAGYREAWIAALEREGATVEVLAATPAAWGRTGPPPGRWDLVIPHVLVEEVVAFSPTLRLAALLEAAGVPLLNPVGAILASSDKLTTHALWAAHGLPQPRVWPLDGLPVWPALDRPLVLKPSYGDGARHIVLVESLEAARETEAAWRVDEAAGGERRGPALLQEWIEEPACVRLFATPHAVSRAYEKSRRPGALVTCGTVYPRIYDPPPELAALARRAVAALGGGLMGLDVLIGRDGRHHVLEANAPFGFDVTDPAQGAFVARAAIATAEGAPGEAVA